MDDTPRDSVLIADRFLSKRKTLATVGFLIVILIDNIVNQSTMVALAESLSTYGWMFLTISDTTAYTLAGVFYNLGKLLLIVPLSRISDKIGRKSVLLFSFGFSIISLIIIYFAETVEIVYIGRLIFGMNSFVGVTTALIDDYYPEETKGKPLGYMSAAMLVGFLLGSLLGPTIFLAFGDKYSFLFLDGLMLISFLNVILFVKDNPNWSRKEQKKLSASEKVIFKKLMRDPRFVGSMIINFFANMTFLGSGIYWNYIILTYFNVPNNVAGLWFLPPLLGDILTYILVPILFRKRLKHVIFYACLAGIPASIILFFKPSLIMFTVSGVVFGILNSSVIQANDTLSLDFIPKEIKGTAIGMLKLFTIGAATAGPLLFGILADVLGTFVPLSFFVIMLVIVGITYWLLVYRNFDRLEPKEIVN
ncbi:MAG: MFS transporter [Promethearchaeota archaeon]